MAFEPPSMNIALVILHADPARGGAERYTIDLAEALISRGHAVTLVAQSIADDLPAANRVLLGAASGGTRVGRYVQFCNELDRHLGDSRYDVVHAMLPVRQCDLYHPHAGIAAEAVAEGHLKHEGPIMRIVSQTANRLNLRRQRFAEVERHLLASPKPATVICLSQYIERSLEKYYQIPTARRAILLNGVDLKRFNPAENTESGPPLRGQLGIADDKIVALMIAQDFVRKGLSEAIAAVAAVADPRLVLVAVGKQDPAPYRELADRLRCSQQLIMPGPCADPRPYYQAADLFVLPTRHDPCSLVVLEALAMGLPVVSTKANGACEAMVSDTHGFVIPDHLDRPNLVESLRKLMDDSTRRKMSEACLALRPALSYDHHVDRLLEIYAAAAASRGATGAA